MELPTDFIHTPPKGFSYHVEEYKKTIVSIWIRNHTRFSYTKGPVSSIWGFYNIKKREYFAPINSKRVGDKVDINRTTPYTSMQKNYTGLESLWM